MKGLILAGGSGTRLHPVTSTVNKQLLPIYDKPMIYYPLSVLMLAGIRDILIISTPEGVPHFRAMFGEGDHLGLKVRYAEQAHPNGLAEAFILGRDFIGNEPCALILGDNIFFGHQFPESLRLAATQTKGASLFAYWVAEPKSYGVVEFSRDGNVIGLEEKPDFPKSNWAATGLYFYDKRVVEIAAEVKPSSRGELEITDINRVYMESNELTVRKLGRGIAWLDTGTHETLLKASQFVEAVEQRQGLKIACIEEIALRSGFIDLDAFLVLAQKAEGSPYGSYLSLIAHEYCEPQ